MAVVLIDNATVSSVFRALGFAPAGPQSTIDIEHVALEQFVEAVLLADRVWIPDTYKRSHQAQRMRLLNHESIHFLSVDQNQDKDISSAADNLTEVWFDAFDASDHSGSVQQYLRQAERMAQFLWEYSSSEFFLVFRALGANPSDPLIDSLLNSDADYETATNFKVIAPDGNEVAWNALAPHVKRLLAVFAWLSDRYLWNQILAAQHDVYYFPHPLRSFFGTDFLARLGRATKGKNEFASPLKSPLTRLKTRLEQINEYAGLPKQNNLTIPNFTPLILDKARDGSEFIEILFETRESNDVIATRELLRQIEASDESGAIGERVKVIREIDKIADNIFKRHGLVIEDLKVSPPLAVTGVKVSGPLEVPFPLPKALFSQFFIGRRYRAFLHAVMQSLLHTAKLGKLKTKLIGFAKDIQEERYSSFYAREDQVPTKYRRRFQSSNRPQL